MRREESGKTVMGFPQSLLPELSDAMLPPFLLTFDKSSITLRLVDCQGVI